MNTAHLNSQPFMGEPEKANLTKNLTNNNGDFSDLNNFNNKEEEKLNVQSNLYNEDRRNNFDTLDSHREKLVINQPLESNGDAATTNSTKEDLKAITIKLKNQNDKLRTQFKELSLKLNETLNKIKANKKRNSQKSEPKEEDPMMKELELCQKQIQLYKREIQILRNKIDAGQSDLRIQSYENKIKDKDRAIEKLLHEKDNLEKIRRDQEKEIEMFQEVFNYQGKIKNYDEEGKKLRAKLREMYEERRANEIEFKKQQEKLVILEERYRDACDRLGISASLNFTKAEDSNKFRGNLSPKGRYKKKPPAESLIKGNKYFGYQADEEDVVDAKLELNEKNMNKLKQDCKLLTKEMSSQEAKFKAEVERLTAQAIEAEKERNLAEEKYKEKEKEVNIMNHRLSEFKRISKFNALQISPKSSIIDNGRISQNV